MASKTSAKPTKTSPPPTTGKPKVHPMLPWIGIAMGFYLFVAYGFSEWCSWLVGDEGFYTVAARCVMQGLRPYRDFLFSQMPLMPYFYAGWFSCAGVSIESARVLSVILGLLALALVGLACFRRGGLAPGVVGVFVLGFNINYIGETLIARTQPLTIFLVAACLFILAEKQPKDLLRHSALAMLFMTAAFLARLSLLPCILLLWAYLAWINRTNLRSYGILLGINLAILGIALAYFYAGGNMFFDIYTFHQEYANFMPWSWARLSSTIHDWLRDELPIVLLFVAATGYLGTQVLGKKASLEAWLEEFAFPLLLLLSYWGATALHWINAQSYATHQSALMPIAVIFSAVVLAPVLERLRQDCGKAAPALLIVLFLIIQMQISGLNLALTNNGNRGLVGLNKAVAILKQHAKSRDASIISFNGELAVNSGLQVAPGYEMCEFSFFPKMSNERCAKLKTVNLDKLFSDLSSQKHQFFCVDDRLFNLMACGSQDIAKELKAHIDQNYEQIGTVPHYGQFDLNLYIFQLKAKL